MHITNSIENMDHLIIKHPRDAFDDEILRQYFQLFIACSGKSVNSLRLDIAEKIALRGDQINRTVKGLKKTKDDNGNYVFTIPNNAFDGQKQLNNVPMDNVLLYTAAVDLTVNLPRGRLIVNKAIADILPRLRRQCTRDDKTLTVAEVEQLRFMRCWYGDKLPPPPLTVAIIEQMKSCEEATLMEPIGQGKAFVVKLGSLMAEWNIYFNTLVRLVDYKWFK
jgi:hypothetical protein